VDAKQMNVYQVFVYLQLLDLLTTLVGFRMGASEASPFIRMLMHVGPAAGVVVSKVLALGIGALCVAVNRGHLTSVFSGQVTSALTHTALRAARGDRQPRPRRPRAPRRMTCPGQELCMFCPA
jgi:hypothetical protein